jgi:uncharacterized membrane protein
MSEEVQTVSEETIKTPKLGYYLILANILIPLTGLAAAIMAYVNQNDCEDWLKGHYRFQIRTFWIGVLYSVIAFFLSFVLIGLILIPAIMIWIFFRGFKGLKAVEAGKPIEKVTTWMW